MVVDVKGESVQSKEKSAKDEEGDMHYYGGFGDFSSYLATPPRMPPYKGGSDTVPWFDDIIAQTRQEWLHCGEQRREEVENALSASTNDVGEIKPLLLPINLQRVITDNEWLDDVGINNFMTPTLTGEMTGTVRKYPATRKTTSIAPTWW